MENKIAIFYHSAKMGNWEEVDELIIGRIKSSGLLDRADIFVKNDCKDIGLYEFPTLQMLDQFAVHNPDYYILYLMNKGVSKPTNNQIADWRECMLYWNVDRWKECIEKLDKGYDAVGINVIDSPSRHFQGNFWWVKAEHIRKLGNISDVYVKEDEKLGINDRHKAEFWVLSREATVYCPYHHHINPYIETNPKSNYVNKKF